MKKSDFENSFVEKGDFYERLRSSASEILTKILSENQIACLPVQSRVKAVTSAGTKLEKKGYSAPFREMTDIVGLRVIVFLERDVNKVEALLRSCFDIDDENSVDKRSGSKVNQVGYRSLHLICCLGEERSKFPEYNGLSDTFFEVQIRTALENTWAEIEHKQNYKSSRSLPDDLQRRLNIISGSLELIDRELSNIVQDAESYVVALQKPQSDVGDDAISETSVRAVSLKVAKDRDVLVRDVPIGIFELVTELKNFGIVTNSELEELLKHSPMSELLKSEEEETTIFGFVREAMMFSDPLKYFNESFFGQFVLNEAEIDEIAKISKVKNIRDLVIEKGGEVFDY